MAKKSKSFFRKFRSKTRSKPRRRRNRTVALARIPSTTVAVKRSPRRRRRSRRAASTAIVRYARRSVSRVRRSFRRRRSSVSRSFGGSSLSVKSLLSQENLFLAGGAVGAAFLTVQVIQRFGPVKTVNGVQVQKGDGTNGTTAEFVLPGLRPVTDPVTNKKSINKIALAAYGVGIPILGAIVIKKLAPGKFSGLAKGMIIGGLISGLTEIIKMTEASMTPASAAASTQTSAGSTDTSTAANTPVQQTAANYRAPRRLGSPVMNALRAVGAPARGVTASPSAFATSAWRSR